jgi:hypothetical protein
MRALYLMIGVLIGLVFVVGCGGCDRAPPLAAGGCCIPSSGGCADGQITADACDGRFWIGRTCSDDDPPVCE